MQIFKGSYYDVGKQQGLLYKKSGLNVKKIIPNLEIIKGQYKEYEKYYPEKLEELRGVADGLGCNVNYVYQKFLANEFEWFNKNFKYNEACTIFGVKDNNNLFVGRNLDWIPETREVMEVYKIHIEGKNKIIAVSDMLITYKDDIKDHNLAYDAIDAINDKGLYIGITFAYGNSSKYGISWKDLVRLISETCETVNDAINIFKKVPLSVPKNFFIADKFGNMVVIEHNSNKFKIIYPQKNVLIKTNHFLDNEFTKIDSVLKSNPYHNTFKRFSAVTKQIGKVKEQMSIQKIVDILSDKKNQVCQTGKLYTIWSLALDMQKQDYYLIKRNDKKFEKLERLYVS